MFTVSEYTLPVLIAKPAKAQPQNPFLQTSILPVEPEFKPLILLNIGEGAPSIRSSNHQPMR